MSDMSKHSSRNSNKSNLTGRSWTNKFKTNKSSKSRCRSNSTTDEKQNNQNWMSFYKNSYINFINKTGLNSTYPFRLTEKRFKWQNIQDKSVVLTQPPVNTQRHANDPQSCFEGGFENFYNKPIEITTTKKRLVFSKINIFDKNSRRVLCPELDNEKPNKTERKKCNYQSTYLRNFNEGSINSLIDQIPTSLPMKNKKTEMKIQYNINSDPRCNKTKYYPDTVENVQTTFLYNKKMRHALHANSSLFKNELKGDLNSSIKESVKNNNNVRRRNYSCDTMSHAIEKEDNKRKLGFFDKNKLKCL